MEPFEQLMDTARAAGALGVSPRTLGYLRVAGHRPRFVKVGRRVRYRVVDLTAYLEERTRRSTVDEGVSTNRGNSSAAR
jgi:hypothetical protein